MTDQLGDEEEPVTCACGRLLTDPESIARKTGPVCWRKLHDRPTPKPRRHTQAAKPGPGQEALPLQDQLELWTSP